MINPIRRDLLLLLSYDGSLSWSYMWSIFKENFVTIDVIGGERKSGKQNH